MSFDALFVLLVLVALVVLLIRGALRPGLVMLSAAILCLCAGILSPNEVIAGFSNKGMITVAMLFLVSEGVRRSEMLEKLLRLLLPTQKATIIGTQFRMLPAVAAISAFLNNTPVVVIFAPMVKAWAERMKLPATKFLIPLSYATIFGGVCTLIGTSTNLVVHGMALSEGLSGFSMFELGQVGIPIAFVGTIYVIAFSRWLLPDSRQSEKGTQETGQRIEVILGARFPALGRSIFSFDFQRKYGARLLEVRRGGKAYLLHDMRNLRFREGDTLVLLADESFMQTWGDSSFFILASDGKQVRETRMTMWRRVLAIVLLTIMVLGAAWGELPSTREQFPNFSFDMFFFVCVVVVVMAWTGIFPARKYTKYISWDILITIAAAFAVGKAMQNSGLSDALAAYAIEGARHLIKEYSLSAPVVFLTVIFILTSVFTELMTNNAAAALAFPLSLSLAEQLGVSVTPFLVTVCIGASASFATPIGYQTNLIVQGIGGYRFGDFARIGIPLNIIVMILTVWLVPYFWPF